MQLQCNNAVLTTCYWLSDDGGDNSYDNKLLISIYLL